MPVRYDIAAGLAQPQQSYSPMNMLAQMQAMDYREQQNALAQAQLAEYQRKAQAQQALQSLLSRPGFDIAAPGAYQEIARAGDIDAARQLFETGARVRMQQPYYGAMTQEHMAGAERQRSEAKKSSLEADSALLGQVGELAARVQQGGEGYNELQDFVTTHPDLPPSIKALVKGGYDPKRVSGLYTTAQSAQAMLAEEIKRRNAQVLTPPTADMPGMITTTQGVMKLPELPYGRQTAESPEPAAPIVRGPNAPIGRAPAGGDFQLPPQVMAAQKEMAIEEELRRTAPIGREREAVGKYRFSKTLTGIGSDYIELAKNYGITVPGENVGERLASLGNKTFLGEFFGKLNASERQAIVDNLKSRITTAIPQFAAAAGLQGKNFDSNEESKRLLGALSDPDNIANVSSAFRNLNSLNEQFGSGEALYNAPKEEAKIISARRGQAGGEEMVTIDIPGKGPHKFPASVADKVRAAIAARGGR
jgi:hypothetical protein